MDDALRLRVEAHPQLDAQAFVTELSQPLADVPSPDWLRALLALDAVAPLRSDDDVRATVRDMLRVGGFKPTGRSKPASEYLVKAATEGRLGSINALVDVCNVVSLHSGLPISVIDLAKANAPFHIAVAAENAQYVFNVSGQTIDLSGLLCLFDREGPCANSVKDAQRTKTDASTRRTLSVVWGAKALGDRATKAAAWYREMLARLGATTSAVSLGT